MVVEGEGSRERMCTEWMLAQGRRDREGKRRAGEGKEGRREEEGGGGGVQLGVAQQGACWDSQERDMNRQ